MDCIILVWKLLDLVMAGNAGHPVLSLLMGIIVLMVFEQSFTGASTGSSGWPISIHIIRKRNGWILRLWKALNPKLSPLLPKDSILPFRTELEEALPIIQDLFHIIPGHSNCFINFGSKYRGALHTGKYWGHDLHPHMQWVQDCEFHRS